MDEWSPSALTENEGLSTQLLPVRRKNEGAPSATPAVSRRSSRIGAWTSLCIVGGTLFTGLTAVLHYMFNAHLENHSVLGYWTQNKSSQVEITLATVFAIVFCFSAGASLCQVSWHAMRRQPLSVADLDALLQEASITTFLRISRIECHRSSPLQLPSWPRHSLPSLRRHFRLAKAMLSGGILGLGGNAARAARLPRTDAAVRGIWDKKITGTKGKPWVSSLNINYLGSCKHFGDVNRAHSVLPNSPRMTEQLTEYPGIKLDDNLEDWGKSNFAIKFIDTLHWCYPGILQCRYILSQTFQFRVVPKNPNTRIWMVLDSPSFEKKVKAGHLLISGSSRYDLIFQHPLLPEIPALEMSAEVSSHAGSIPVYSTWQFIKQPD
ncbi:hypothetical protein B0H13DRAFT_1886604 [Mycena leptocephala]|nr:hypothetical protein B0H13DRAFT_1886604 [Mycena leptocephala]